MNRISTTVKFADALKNMPWEDRPAGSSAVLWRYSANPVIPRDLLPTSNSIFNSAVVPFNGKFAGVFRCDNKKRDMNLNRGFSDDGIHWKLDNDPIDWKCADPEIGAFQSRYDPRVLWLADRYYVTWCNGYHGPTIGIGYTFDFEKFTFLENALLPCNRNGVLFPRKINGRYVMYSRPSDNGQKGMRTNATVGSPLALKLKCHLAGQLSTAPVTWFSNMALPS